MVARIVLALALALPFTAWGQSFNGTFEALQPSGVPSGWSLADPGGAATSPEAHLGKRAAKAWVHDGYLSGMWISNSSAVDGNAAEVTGYYKYLGDKKICDKATVAYLLGAKGAEGGIDTMVYGHTELKLEKSYSKFQLSVSAISSGTPDFVSIQFKPVGHCNPHGESNCCFLFVDDIILAGTTTLAAPVMEEPVMEEPQPEESPEEAPVLERPLEGKVPVETPVLEEKMSPEEAPVESEKKAPEATEATDENAIPVEEGGSTEPVEEGWDTEESSNDGGL